MHAKNAITKSTKPPNQTNALIMADQQDFKQMELQLAIARDNDDRDLVALVVSIILACRAKKIN
jgi:hypothetical protein